MEIEKIKIQVEMEVTEAQALALEAMFNHWNYLSNVGSDREVSFYVAGDSDFHPKCKFNVIEGNKRELTPELDKLALTSVNGFDYDNIAWRLNDEVK